MKKQPVYNLRSVADDSRSRRGRPLPVAGAYDAERGARLQREAARAHAQALVAGIMAADGGRQALAAAFPGACVSEATVGAARVVAAAAREQKTMARLKALAEAEGVGVSVARLCAVRAREMAAAIAAKYGNRPEAFARLLLNAFRGLATVSERIDAERVVADAVAHADALGRLERLAKSLGVELSAKVAKKLRTGARRADLYGAAVVDAVQKRGAKMPTEELAKKRSWRVRVVDTPEGLIAKPAFVVAIEANAPIGRLSRPARAGDEPALQARHVRAAEEVCKLYFASLKNAKLVGSYDGVVVEGGEGRGPIDNACDSWRKLESALAQLLKVERDVVMEVCVYETPIETLARRRDLVHFSRPDRAHGAVVQTLRCGLERLAERWGLDLGATQDA